ncbi:MAG TPA: serine/threonine-protein kinase, partial [Streptosporangiaceae bacterium]
MEPLTPDDPAELAGYRLRAQLGSGGMGRVYLANTPGGRPVALKVVHRHLSDNPTFRARFRQEIQAARQVHGLYTAALLDADPDADPPWLVTAYVAGPSLAGAVAAHGPIPAVAVPGLMAGVAEALQVIHATGLVHRDLKPSNVLLSPDGPRVIDFGIARALDGVDLTHSGIHVGSPPFMAPEQIRALPVTPALDVFALGSLAAFALLGRPPFGDDSAAAVMHRVLWEAPDLTDCPPALRPVIENCLAKEPGQRPSAAEIIESCRALPAVETIAYPPAWPPPVPSGPDQPWPMPAQPMVAVLPEPMVAVLPEPVPAGTEPVPAVTVPGPAPAAPAGVVRVMYAAAALAVLSAVAGLATRPMLRSMLARQHPVATHAAIGSALAAAVVIMGVRGLVSGLMWVWTGTAARRGRPYAGLLAAALIVTTVAVAGSFATGLSTVPDRAVGLAGWLAGLGAAVLSWRAARRSPPA